MQFKTQAKVMGVAHFVGNIEGKDLDSGTIFVEEALDESSERSKGFRSVEYKCPDHSLAKALLHNAFPLMAELSVESKVTKSGQSLMVTAVRPLQLAQNAKGA